MWTATIAVVSLVLGMNLWRFRGKNKYLDGAMRVVGGEPVAETPLAGLFKSGPIVHPDSGGVTNPPPPPPPPPPAGDGHSHQ